MDNANELSRKEELLSGPQFDAVNRPGFHAHFLSWEGWHDAEQIRRKHQGQGGPTGP
jgi:hypothetical protein